MPLYEDLARNMLTATTLRSFSLLEEPKISLDKTVSHNYKLNKSLSTLVMQLLIHIVFSSLVDPSYQPSHGDEMWLSLSKRTRDSHHSYPKFNSFSSITDYQINIGCWSISRVLKWLFYLILCSIIVVRWEGNLLNSWFNSLKCHPSG